MRGVLPVGRSAVLVECGGLSPARLRAALLEEDDLDAIEDAVPAATTVLVRFRPRISPLQQRSLIEGARSRTALDGDVPSGPGRLLEVPVVYDGEDLSTVAEHAGVSVRECIDLHSAAEHTVEFFGFAPGVAYLGGVPEPLRLPRRTSPRVRIPAGTLAIAAGQSLVYPGGTPGGWHLIGSTDVRLWNADLPVPNYFDVSDRVRFVPVKGLRS